jgi:hypothetical protein
MSKLLRTDCGRRLVHLCRAPLSERRFSAAVIAFGKYALHVFRVPVEVGSPVDHARSIEVTSNRHATKGLCQLWPDADESTRSAIGAGIAERTDSLGTTADGLRTK